MKEIIIERDNYVYRKHENSVDFALYFRHGIEGEYVPPKVHFSYNHKVLCGTYLFLAEHYESDVDKFEFNYAMSTINISYNGYCKKCLSKVTILE